MPDYKKIFLADSKIAFDKKHRKTINFNISKYDQAVKTGKQRYVNFEKARQSASNIKNNVVNNLADYLLQFEKNASNNGIEVIWSRNAKEAISEIEKIVKDNNARLLVKSKSMISEEIELNENIEKAGTEPVETDLGEFIVQVAGEKPYHILTPAMHKSKEDVAQLFHKHFQTNPNSTPEELTLFVRGVLRKKFTCAEIGVTGANFLLADVGGIVLTENEGNGFMSVAFPKIHIVITGLEKIIPSINDLPLFLPVLTAKGTGQQVTVYNSVLTGPRKNNEENGPEKMYVLLLDNNRSKLATEKELLQSLKCIRCGACLNACPIYKNVGGYTYNATYSGPIGSVITPVMQGMKEYNHLSYACSTCGACTEVCPVKIPLHELLLKNRKDAVKQNLGNRSWNLGMQAFAKSFGNRKYVDIFSGGIKNKLLRFRKSILGEKKEVPQFSKKSFSKQWKLNLNK